MGVLEVLWGSLGCPFAVPGSLRGRAWGLIWVERGPSLVPTYGVRLALLVKVEFADIKFIVCYLGGVRGGAIVKAVLAQRINNVSTSVKMMLSTTVLRLMLTRMMTGMTATLAMTIALPSAPTTNRSCTCIYSYKRKRSSFWAVNREF